MQSRLVRYGKILGALWLFLNPTAAASNAGSRSISFNVAGLGAMNFQNNVMTNGMGEILYSAANPVNYDQMWLNAVADGRVDLLQFLFQNRDVLTFDIYQKATIVKFPDKMDAFSVACLLGRSEVIRFFYERNLLLGEQGFIAKQTDPVRNSGIFNAIVMGKVKVLKLLRQYGVDLNLDMYMFNLGRKSIGEYGPGWRETALRTLLKVGGNPNMHITTTIGGSGNSYNNFLTDLITHSDLEHNESFKLVKILLDHRDINMYEENGDQTLPMQHAVVEQRVDIVVEFCRRNYNIHHFDSAGDTIYTYIAHALRTPVRQSVSQVLNQLRNFNECRSLVQAIDRISISLREHDAAVRQPTINDQPNGSWSPLWVLFAVGVPVLFYLFLNRNRTVENKVEQSKPDEDSIVDRKKPDPGAVVSAAVTPTSTTAATLTPAATPTPAAKPAAAPAAKPTPTPPAKPTPTPATPPAKAARLQMRDTKTASVLLNRDKRKEKREAELAEEAARKQKKQRSDEEKEKRRQELQKQKEEKAALEAAKREVEAAQNRALLISDEIQRGGKLPSRKDVAKDNKLFLVDDLKDHGNFLTHFNMPQENQGVYILAFIFHFHRYNLLRLNLLSKQDVIDKNIASDTRTMMMHAPELFSDQERMEKTIQATIAPLKGFLPKEVDRIHKAHSYEYNSSESTKGVNLDSLPQTPFYQHFHEHFAKMTNCDFKTSLGSLSLIKDSLVRIRAIMALDNPANNQSYRLNSYALNVLLTICGECLDAIQSLALGAELRRFLTASKKIRNEVAHECKYETEDARLRKIIGKHPEKLSDQVVRLIHQEKLKGAKEKRKSMQALTRSRAVMFLPQAESAPAVAPAQKTPAPTATPQT